MGLWTGVRLPSTPLESKRSNTVPISKIAVFKSAFGIVLDTNEYDTLPEDQTDYSFTFTGIQKWIKDNLDMNVSKSSITMVKDKCKIDKIDFKAGIEPEPGIIKTNKEKAVLEAFRALGIV